MKNIDGIYQVDMLGPYGWERFSTAFINRGEFRSASAEHFTAGACKVDGEGFTMDGNLTQFVDHRPLFGAKKIDGLPIEFRGTIAGDVIDGEASPVEDKKYRLRFRLNRLPNISQTSLD